MNRACDVRLAFFANLLARDHSVTILNRFSKCKDANRSNVILDPKIEVVESFTNCKKSEKGGVAALILFVLSVLLEPYKIFKRHRKQKIDVIHIYSGHYLDFVHYRLIAKIIGAKVVYQYVEFKSIIDTKNFYHRVNNWLCDNKGALLWDGVIAISDFLLARAKAINPDVKEIKIPPLCDFTMIDSLSESHESQCPYLLYCGSIGYREVIDFILESFEQSEIRNTHRLMLVLSGNADEIAQFRIRNSNCEVLSALPYATLVSYYKGADGLLIPLRNTVKDIARFPNKICEYLACKGLIVTTNNGEIPLFFKDGFNAVVASEYSEKAMVQKLDAIAEGLYDAKKIKEEAYKTGWANFDINSYQVSVMGFLKDVVGTKEYEELK